MLHDRVGREAGEGTTVRRQDRDAGDRHALHVEPHVNRAGEDEPLPLALPARAAAPLNDAPDAGNAGGDAAVSVVCHDDFQSLGLADTPSIHTLGRDATSKRASVTKDTCYLPRGVTAPEGRLPPPGWIKESKSTIE